MKKIYVGNLSFKTTEDELRGLFATHGQVDSVSIITEPGTGRPRGFAFVEMGNDGDAEKAIAALQGTDVGGRQINVNEARPKKDRGERGGPASLAGSLAFSQAGAARPIPTGLPRRCLWQVIQVQPATSARKSRRGRKSSAPRQRAGSSESWKS